MKTTLLLTGLALAAAAPVARAGMVWNEIDDAGSLIGEAQWITGSGPVTQIVGSTTGGTDEQDMYIFEIKEVSTFTAITGEGSYDTQLWLFDLDGYLITGNDDDNSDDPPPSSPQLFGSTLLSGPNDDGTPGLVTPGLYALVVSGFGTPTNGPGDPVSDMGLMADQADFSEHTGPDGFGGSNPLSGWVPGAATGDYNILLTSASAVPAPGALALLGLAGLVASRRRRR